MDTIDGMRTFVAVATHGSFTGGAARVGITTKLASKYVRQLEARLSAQLFNRTTRSVTLTETGKAYLERCLPVLDQFDELEGLVQERQSELAGRIRITAPTAFGSRQLIEAIAPFQKQHPKVSIDLHLSDKRVSLTEDGFDLAIRIGRLEDSSLIARKLSGMRSVVFASPSYLSTHGEPTDPHDLMTHNCLALTTAIDPEHWRFNINEEQVSVRVEGSFRANSPRAIAHAAAGGVGIGMGPIYVVQPFLASGELKLLFEDFEATEFALNALYPPNRHLTARIRALIEHLVKVFAD